MFVNISPPRWLFYTAFDFRQYVIAVAAAADKQSNGAVLHSQTFYGKNLSEV